MATYYSGEFWCSFGEGKEYARTFSRVQGEQKVLIPGNTIYSWLGFLTLYGFGLFLFDRIVEQKPSERGEYSWNSLQEVFFFCRKNLLPVRHFCRIRRSSNSTIPSSFLAMGDSGIFWLPEVEGLSRETWPSPLFPVDRIPRPLLPAKVFGFLVGVFHNVH